MNDFVVFFVFFIVFSCGMNERQWFRCFILNRQEFHFCNINKLFFFFNRSMISSAAAIAWRRSIFGISFAYTQTHRWNLHFYWNDLGKLKENIDFHFFFHSSTVECVQVTQIPTYQLRRSNPTIVFFFYFVPILKIVFFFSLKFCHSNRTTRQWENTEHIL